MLELPVHWIGFLAVAVKFLNFALQGGWDHHNLRTKVLTCMHIENFKSKKCNTQIKINKISKYFFTQRIKIMQCFILIYIYIYIIHKFFNMINYFAGISIYI